ncbi:MAG TPA: carboxypeptidase-like regulatory domain-containing protein [Kofleriaceae bacterium]|nr:carboxypeptidase-like regulatory domain-containing protein [Kofleriaceae bacterium]
MAAVAVAGLILVIYMIVALSAGDPVGPAGIADAVVGSDGAPVVVAVKEGKGPHELRGTVTDAAGQGVAGVSVLAEMEMGPGVRGRAVGSGSGSGAESVVAVAGGDGSFVLRGMEAGRHRLRVQGAGVLTAEVRFVEVPGPVVRVVVARRVALRGRVTDGGRGVAGAVVRLLPLGGSAPVEAATGEDGEFAFDDLPEGRYRVWAARGDRAAPAQPVDRVGAGPFEPLELGLAPAAIVAGRVVDGATGRGVVAHVTLVADDPEEPPRAATSVADGSFRVEGVPLGRWTADAFAPGHVSADSVRFQAGAHSPSVELQRGGILVGRVVDGNGQPVAGAVVLARAEGGGADVSEQTMARRLGAPGWGWGSAAASASMSASGSGLVTATGLRYVPRGELGVLMGPLPYPPPAGSTGAVRIASPLGPPGAAAPDLPVDPALESHFTTDKAGRFRVTGLSPGTYRVLASHPDFADGASDLRAVDLGTALDDVEVMMVGGLVLHGVVTDDRGAVIAGATLEARAERGGADPRYSVTDRDGRYRLGPLAADVRVEVSAAGKGRAWREVHVERLGRAPVAREENFTLVLADAVLQGQVTDESGFAVRGASVRVASGGSAGAPPATTDAAGRFRLTGLVAGRLRLRIEHADYPPAELEAATGTDAQLRIGFGGGVSIEVRDRAGAALAGAEVELRGPGGERRTATAGRDGIASIAPLAAGTWTVEASARGHATGSAEVEVAAGTRPRQLTAPPVRIALSPGATLAGVVRDQDGERVAGAAIAAGSARTTSDEHGRFRLTQVPTGPVTVEAEKGDARGALDLDLAPGDELVTLELRVE